MKQKQRNSKTAQTFKPFIEGTGIDRLYKRVGVRRISFFYQHPDGSRETIATAPKGDREATKKAETLAKSRATDIQAGVIVVGSVGEMIDRFAREVDPAHFRDQSKDGLAVRRGTYKNLRAFFGKMAPRSLRTFHGYQYLDTRALAGAPKKANKEMAMMSTVCHYGVRWGVLEANPFVGMMQNKGETSVRAVSRSQVVRFYLWALRQEHTVRIQGCAALFTYLTGFRAAEVRPFHISGLSDDGVRVVNAKRKKGEAELVKVRNWSRKLYTVVARAKATHKAARMYLFANSLGKPYTRSGWGSNWSDAMFAWIASFDSAAAADLAARREWEAARRRDKSMGPYKSAFVLVDHPAYFSLLDVRPTAITQKLSKRAADTYDFAAHANPATTHRNYDRRKEKRASATE